MFFFILELILNTWSKTTYSSFSPKIKFEGYLFSFYWWLDLIAIVSMWFDIDWIAVPMGIGGVSSSVSGTSNLAKAGRVVRLVRLVRLVKLFKIASERRKRAQQEQQLMELVAVGAISFLDIEKQRALNSERKSKLGSELSESTTRRVIVIVLIMVCILPLLSSPAPNTGPDYALSLIQHLQMDQTVSSEALNAIYDELSDDFHTRNGENYLIQLDSYVGMRRVYHLIDSDKFGKLRDDATYFEDVVAYNATRTKFETSATFSLRPLEYDSAMFSVLMTIFIGGLLVVGSVVFVGDTEELVLKPIGRMMNMVEEVAKDPLQPLNIGDNGGEYETRLLETTIEKITGLLRVGFGEAGAGIISANLSASDGGTSTINPLLPGVRVYAIVGFCDIHQFEFVNQNLASDILRFVNTIAEIVHSRVHYWGGQCNKNLGNAFVVIWRIGDEETLKNQITGFGKKGSLDKDMAQVVLQAQATNPASPNRLSAKFNSGGSTPTSATAAAATSPATAASYASAASPAAPKVKSNVLDLRRVPGVDNLANQALIGYLKIIAEINRSLAVLTYRTEPRLTLHGQQEFSVRMGFGLHAGWAIEGAVGSLQKVDATYLSPHVNMAARLETSSRQYGVPILISHFTHELFSSEVQDYCRRVDVCTVKGSEVPIGVFTYDALQDQAFIHKNTRGKQEKWCPEDGPQIVQKKKIRRMDSTMTSAAKSSKKNTSNKMGFALDEAGGQLNPEEDDQDDNPPVFAKSDEDPSDVFDNDVDLVMLRNHVTEECKF